MGKASFVPLPKECRADAVKILTVWNEALLDHNAPVWLVEDLAVRVIGAAIGVAPEDDGTVVSETAKLDGCARIVGMLSSFLELDPQEIACRVMQQGGTQ